MTREAFGALGDVDGMVADALEVVVDLQGPDEEAQVDGHGLLEGQQGDRRVFDLQLQAVDLLVRGDDRPRLLGVHLREGFDRMVDLALDLPSHEYDLAA